MTDISTFCIEKSDKPVKINESVKLLGFPAYAPGHSYSIFDSKISKTYVASAVNKFEIAAQIREGNSGGPIINSASKVVGIALEGATKSEGHNGCLVISEIDNFLHNKLIN
jgi:S1-C subfamily serine protease